MPSVQLRISTTEYTLSNFDYYELYASETNLPLGDVIDDAEFNAAFDANAFIHANLAVGETWYYWLRASYDFGETFSALVALGSITITGAGQTFLALTDTPDAYTGHGEKAVAVKADESGLEFIDFPAGGSGGSPSQTIVPPQGRLTLTSGSPVMTASATAQTTIYYSPYVGRSVPIYDGTDFDIHEIAELSQATTDNTKSPAAVANNSNYDLFVWDDAGTERCTRGPAWTSATARGTGAGTTELERVNGILVNKIAITNGPAARRGTYVGTVRSNGSAQIDHILGGVGAAGGEDTILGVWNMYNRVDTALINFDNTDTWNYNTDTYRVKNGDSSNRISFIIGLQEDCIEAVNGVLARNTNADVRRQCAIGLDSETAPAIGSFVAIMNIDAVNSDGHGVARYSALAPLGFHYVAPLEAGVNTGTTTWEGDAGGTSFYSCFQMNVRA